jgi:hypothetical protein
MYRTSHLNVTVISAIVGQVTPGIQVLRIGGLKNGVSSSKPTRAAGWFSFA